MALIDASEGFDSVRYDRLFDLIYKKCIPPIMLRTPRKVEHPGRTLAGLMVFFKEETFLY